MVQSLAGLAPPYTSPLTAVYSIAHWPSADTSTCVVCRTNTRLGDRSFSTSGPKNIEQSAVRLSSAVFKQHLKAHLFNAI